MKMIQKFGLLLFLLGMATFVATMTLGRFTLTEQIIDDRIGGEPAKVFKEVTSDVLDQEYGSQFSFVPMLEERFKRANDTIIQRHGILEAHLDQALATLENPNDYKLEAWQLIYPGTAEGSMDSLRKAVIEGGTNWIVGRSYEDGKLREELINKLPDLNSQLIGIIGFTDSNIKDYKFYISKSATVGPLIDHYQLWFLIFFVVTIFGALLYIFPKFWDGPAGIKHHGIYHSAATNRGWIGIIVGTFLIVFYVFLYWFPMYMTNWVIFFDPIKQFLQGGNPDAEASEWFLYGTLYCIAMLVMGIRMFTKYRGNTYQIVRTTSVLFFQIGFAFLIPEIIELLNQDPAINLPARDFKNAWPLDYQAFYDYKLEDLTQGSFGAAGWAVLFWSIALVVIVVPVMVYVFGKRWYCSWVCGCGGLAETVGDPYRQLSDKSVKAWKVERWMIHTVLVFAWMMTLGVAYTFLVKHYDETARTIFVVSAIGLMVVAGVLAWVLQQGQRRFPSKITKIYWGVAGVVSLIMVYNHFIAGSENLMFMSSYSIRASYGFLIGAAFAGVVGTGFYPLMGNRMWCRFGCPLAAWLGLMQRLKSRFRITTNGGQCISCGNCSTYCEMGIDVRWYAQRGQNIVRSSCVGCGVCSSVCPRGVLKLENGPDDEARINDNPILIGNDSITLNPETQKESLRA